MATSQMHVPTVAAVAVGTAACAVGLTWAYNRHTVTLNPDTTNFSRGGASGGEATEGHEGPSVPMGTLFVFGLGFSGARLARSLRARGWQVGGTTRSETAAAAFRDEGIAALAFDSINSEGLEAVVLALQQATRAYAQIVHRMVVSAAASHTL